MELFGAIEKLTSLDPWSVGLKALLLVFCIVVWWKMRSWTEFD
jgi:hypothetical protein